MLKTFLLGNLIIVVGIGSLVLGVIFSNVIKILLKDFVDMLKNVLGKCFGSGERI